MANSKITITFIGLPLINSSISFKANGSLVIETFKMTRTVPFECDSSGVSNGYKTALGLDYNTGGAYIITRPNSSTIIIESTSSTVNFSDFVGFPGYNSAVIENTYTPPPPSITRTPIVGPSQITFTNSPVHLRIQNTAQDSTIKKATVYLWIWSGAQDRVLGSPNVTLQNSIISLADDYIGFQISDILRAYIERPNNGTNSNQPGFGYNVNALPAVSGQGVFWQIQTLVESTGGTETIDYDTNFATLGYHWNHEQDGTGTNYISKYGSLGFSMPVVKWYNSNVPKYFAQDFVFNQAINVATSSNMVSIVVENKTRTRCTRDACLIVYLDRRGLWDVFTPHGKITVTPKTQSQTSKRVFRDSSRINNSITHSKLRDSISVEQEYTINTGIIDESEVQRIEEIIYSPKVYLIKFLGDIVYQVGVGITIDSTFVTIDDTNITIDNTPITPLMVPYFNTFQQIPVVVEDSDFIRKTLINDKNGIDYNLKFTETNNKLNDIR